MSTSIPKKNTKTGKNTKEALFRNLVESELKKEGVLTLRLKKKLLACAREQGYLTQPVAAKIIDAVVNRLHLPVDKEEEARTHLFVQIKQTLQTGAPDRNVLFGLYTAAHQIGLERDHVDDVIDRIQTEASEKTRKTLFYAGVIVVPLLVIGVGAGILALNNSSTPNRPRFAGLGSNDTKKESDHIPLKLDDGKSWIVKVKGLEDALGQLNKLFPTDQAIFEGLGARKDMDRLLAYQDFLLKLHEFYETPEARPHLVRLLAGCYAADPADSNAEQIETWLVSQFPKQSDKIVSSNAANFKRRLWYAGVTVAAIKHPQITNKRHKTLIKGIEQQLEEPVDAGGDEKKVLQDVSAAMCRGLLKNVLVTATEFPNVALSISDPLNEVAASFLTEATVRDAEADMIVTVLDQPKVDPKLVEPKLTRQFPTFNPELKKTVLMAYRSAAPELAAAIEPILTSVIHANIAPGMNQQQKAEAMLKVIERHDKFFKLATMRSSAISAKADQAGPILQETINLAHASTLACALAQQAAGTEQFDELFKKMPVLGASKSVTKKDEKPKNDGGGVAVVPPVPAGPRVIKGSLSPYDPLNRYRSGRRADTHIHFMNAGQTYFIDMIGSFDTYLFLENPAGRYITQNDDGGPGLNARIVFTAPFSGQYRIIASSYSRTFGPYTVTIGTGPGGAFPGAAPVFMQPAVLGVNQKVQKVDIAKLLPLLYQLRNNSFDARRSAFQQIANFSNGDLNPAAARELAAYILPYTNKTEFDSKLQSLQNSQIKDSRLLKLAIVDYLAGESELSRNKVESIFSVVIGKEISFPNKSTWRQDGRAIMLEHVIDNMKDLDPVDDAAQKLRELYVKQGVLLGMNAKAFGQSSSVSQVLEKLINHVVGRLQTQTLSAEDRKLLDDVPGQLLVAEFIAANDLQKTVALQRQWLKILAIQVALQQPASAKQARSICQNMPASDADANHILTQLREGERQILQMWRLLHNAN